MRHRLALLLLLLPPAVINAQFLSSASGEHILSVTGVGSILVEPDHAMLSLEARGQANNVAQAKELTDRIAGSFVERIEAIGVDSNDIRSDPMTVALANDRDGRSYTSYTRVTTVIIRDLEMFEEIEGAAIESGITNIGQIQYSHSNFTGLQDEALAAAFEDARGQAEQTAEALGLSLGRVISVNVSARATPTISNVRTLAFSAAPANRRTGLIQINRSVNISYRLLE